MHAEAMTSMPGKLITVIVLLGLSLVSNLLNGNWFGGLIGLGCIVGLFMANDVVRKAVIFFSCVNAAFGAVAVFGGVLMAVGMEVIAGMTVIVVGVVGVLANVFSAWALTRDDVIQWMLYRGINQLEEKASRPTDL